MAHQCLPRRQGPGSCGWHGLIGRTPRHPHQWPRKHQLGCQTYIVASRGTKLSRSKSSYFRPTHGHAALHIRAQLTHFSTYAQNRLPSLPTRRSDFLLYMRKQPHAKATVMSARVYHLTTTDRHTRWKVHKDRSHATEMSLHPEIVQASSSSPLIARTLRPLDPHL